MIEVRGVGQRAGGGRRTLRDVSLTIESGELVAIIGGSGAGKTTLLDAIAGVRPPAEGKVSFDGEARSNGGAGAFGYVPQDDIVHLEMPLRRTLRYAAGLRLPSGTPPERADRAVDAVMDALALTERAGQRVGSLSGGERKRASIAVELLTRPRVFFLDEPTSGLDPATAADLMRLLRGLADSGTTVVLTTHHPPDVAVCDRVAVLTQEGRLAFYGEPDKAREEFRVTAIEDIYLRLAKAEPHEWEGRFGAAPAPVAGPNVGAFRQWALLARRNLDLLSRNRLTLAVLAGSPVMVLAMFAVLFRPGAFAPESPSPGATVMILFWIAFGGFFFGLTYGLLQICTELPVVRRERLTGLRVGSYVLAKVAVLLPLLAAVDALMLGVLRGLDRLPAMGWGTYAELFVTLLLCSLAALALGLLVSAAVTDPAQATMALPMLCFPQVLFVGAVLPVPVMAAPGRWLSYAMSNRWAFEGLGHSLGVERLWGSGRSPLGPPLLASYGHTFARAVAVDWAVLTGFTAVLLAATCLVLARRT
ncbi:ATP-binding cassette domain-containing protein [Actinomadura soli]|uniref:ATP-binding cassette domain-containing protein n=1 Tax=Actinomadura soli TaxID=2508997 RepID=A0A5C4JF33_9ACTN|nr:ATP-binding cassette domain-containing protein [Actinomadura soli]TMR02709.1 ATP-binding cassette domain-containing protein [Actinomadura soli]